MNLSNFINPILEYDYSTVLFVWKIFAFAASAALLWGIIYSAMKINQVGRAWLGAALYSGYKEGDESRSAEEALKARAKWESILKKGASENESDRKLALIAADSLVDDIFKMSGYKGENLGERLKLVEKGDIIHLDELWEAHKVRNKIAHEADYKLSQEGAMEALTNYGKVLRELKYI